jgi:hypothetical protein
MSESGSGPLGSAPPCVVSFVASGDCSDALLEQRAAYGRKCLSCRRKRRLGSLRRGRRALLQACACGSCYLSKDRKPHRMYADRGWPSATCRASGKLTGRTSDHRCRGASRRRYGTVPMSSFSSITAQLRPASRCAHRMTVTTRQQRQRGRIDDAVRHPGRRRRPSV